jgi:SDR family mycofactocin-dependent oxidoreductase
MGTFENKVVLITGGARGQGRSHAVGFARQGAHVAIADILEPVETVPYATSTGADADETQRQVEAIGGRCLVEKADVRNGGQLRHAVEHVEAELGPIDVLVANAGIASICAIRDMGDAQWQTMLDINLTGVFNAIRAVLPGMCDRGHGRIVATSSIAGRLGAPNIGHYVAAKWGVIGLVKSVALEVAADGITVNAVAPTSVNTPMIQNLAFRQLFVPDVDDPPATDVEEAYRALNPIPVPWVEPEDVTHAVMFLASDEARYISGEVLTVSAGWAARNAM